jgi:hypothetical protein
VPSVLSKANGGRGLPGEVRRGSIVDRHRQVRWQNGEPRCWRREFTVSVCRGMQSSPQSVPAFGQIRDSNGRCVDRPLVFGQ